MKASLRPLIQASVFIASFGTQFCSCTSPVGTGAAAGAGVGALGGYLYDRHDKRDDGDPQRWDRERMSNVGRGAAIGAGVGAGAGYLSGRAAQNQPANPYGYPQQGYPQQGYPQQPYPQQQPYPGYYR